LLREIVKKPLSMGADELVLLEDEAFAEGDSWSIAFALAMAIKKIGEYDLIFCGREASDWNAGLGLVVMKPGCLLATCSACIVGMPNLEAGM
ncbi:unnamed protein product, partial [marine sediment metagenome]